MIFGADDVVVQHGVDYEGVWSLLAAVVGDSVIGSAS